jgi:hypothetical protein
MASDDSNGVQQTPIPTDEELDQFKNYVKKFHRYW